MKRILIIAIAIICSVTANSVGQVKRGSEIPCSDTATQAEANECARREYRKVDAEVNKLYLQLLSGLASYKGNDQEKLRRAQALWQLYRDATFESEASIYQGGSIRPAVYNSCLASVTRERAKRLTEFLATTKQ